MSFYNDMILMLSVQMELQPPSSVKSFGEA